MHFTARAGGAALISIGGSACPDLEKWWKSSPYLAVIKLVNTPDRFLSYILKIFHVFNFQSADESL
jgi:hypothetical protein